MRLRLSPSLLVAAVRLSCGRPPTNVQKASPRSRFADPVPRNHAADDVGRLLSALPVEDDESFQELEGQEPWIVHRRDLDRLWEKVDDQWIPAMREFHRKELNGAPFANSVLFYPFSGSDVLMATVFFPRSPMCAMVGLELAGTLPTPMRFAKSDLPTYLAEIRESISSELERSFFITREMDRDFRGRITDGLSPPILLLLARTQHTILGHRYVRLDADGRVVERAAGRQAPGRTGDKGVNLEFRADTDQSVHKLCYFSVNLADERLKGNQSFSAFLDRLKGMTTFLKATSYMPHGPAFSIIRERILAGSNAILQDDPGIPHHHFGAPNWQVQLYGNYTRPYGSFRWLEQPDLRRAYETTGPRPLAFQIGHGFRRIPSNLQLAERRQTRTAR